MAVYLLTYTHILVFQRDISERSQQEDGDTAWTSGSGTIPSLDHWHLLLPCVIPSPTISPHPAWLLTPLPPSPGVPHSSLLPVEVLLLHLFE